ncbi:MAG: AmmeMemoRadiSam system radical SAM enzyme [Candidatus Margulisbacteria bacterium]|nr:AmmeMemoRadiSam system radical SAM enzyme [Candidatus Margulisiibacteriota bacterium]
MRKLILAVTAVFVLALLAQAIQLTTPFSKMADALKLIRAANLSKYKALHWQSLGNKVVRCELCPNRCVLPDLARGLCGVRINLGGRLYSLVYGKPVAVHVDPIEKKPLSHFLPGTTIFSIATAGCNLGCVFCQNWQISQSRPEEADHENLSPQQIVDLTKKSNSPSLAFTYTEPTIFYEYMLDTARLAKQAGLRTVMHSCGYINPKPLKELLKYMDAANIDLKGFSEKYYQEMSYGHLQPVLDSLKAIKKAGVWLEITNLIVPGRNDDPEMIRRMSLWIKDNLGPDVPLYFSAFTPMYKLTGLPPTPVQTLEQAAKIAKEAGLHYVYIGNVYGHAGENTICPACGKVLIEREGYTIRQMNLTEGRCKFCGYKIAGVWD